MKINKSYIFTLISFVFVTFLLSSSYVSAGGGPQLICKEMAQKQGWLIDDTKFDEELSSNACISRKPTVEEKDKILEFCKAEPKGEFRTECFDKCKKYYTDMSFRECNKNEISSIKSAMFTSKAKSIFNRQLTLAETIIVAFVVVLIFYLVVSLFKNKKSSNKQSV